MAPITLADIATAIGATPTTGPTIHAVCTDTREMKPNSLFVALCGDNFDGHDYLAKAAGNGAVAALVDRDVPLVPGLTQIKVDDTRRAMGRLATFVRRRFKGTVIAVAGSNGKTGTKHLIHAALSSTLRGTMSPKSFNNDVGVPVTIFAAPEDDDFVVLEMGTNHPGELANLSRIAEPDVAVITNVGAEHLEFFHDLHGVRQEEASVTTGLRPDGLLVVNGDDPDLLPLVTGHVGPLLTFGWAEDNHVRPTHVVSTPHGTTFDWWDDLAGSLGPFFVPQLGRHTALNAMAAVLVGNHLGVDLDKVRQGLAGERGPEMRLQVDHAGPVTILNDAYNANPSSTQAALETVRELTVPGRRIAVLGDMLEMGDAATAGHADVGRLAAASNLDALICVGPLSKEIAAAATAAGLANVSHVATTAEAEQAVPSMLQPGDLVLLKGSRGMRLEKVATAIHTKFG